MENNYREELKDLLDGTVDNPQSIENIVPDAIGQGLDKVQPEDEPVIEIDVRTRKITVPQELINIGVEGDHLAETVFFELSRYADGLDLSEHKCTVHVVNAGKEYVICNTTIASLDTDKIKIGWSLDNRVTKYKGTIKFTVQFDTMNTILEYQWSTVPAEMIIMAGLDINSVVPPKDTTVLLQALNRISTLESQMAAIMQLIYNMNLEPRVAQLETDVTYLKSNAVLIAQNVPDFLG